jgi:hypothetical protein
MQQAETSGCSSVEACVPRPDFPDAAGPWSKLVVCEPGCVAARAACQSGSWHASHAEWCTGASSIGEGRRQQLRETFSQYDRSAVCPAQGICMLRNDSHRRPAIRHGRRGWDIAHSNSVPSIFIDCEGVASATPSWRLNMDMCVLMAIRGQTMETGDLPVATMCRQLIVFASGLSVSWFRNYFKCIKPSAQMPA